MMYRGVSLAVLATLAIGCAPPAGRTSELSDADKAAILRARDSTIAVLNRGDMAHLYDTFSADHVTAPPNVPSLPAGDKLRSWHQALFDAGTLHGSFTPAELVGEGDLAIDRYGYTLSVQPKAGGKAIEDRGKGLWIWKRQADGSWKLWYAIWNSDLPLAPPGK